MGESGYEWCVLGFLCGLCNSPKAITYSFCSVFVSFLQGCLELVVVHYGVEGLLDGIVLVDGDADRTNTVGLVLNGRPVLPHHLKLAVGEGESVAHVELTALALLLQLGGLPVEVID